jgi:hypothetical protein
LRPIGEKPPLTLAEAAERGARGSSGAKGGRRG